jgi:hypothetical protein
VKRRLTAVFLLALLSAGAGRGDLDPLTAQVRSYRAAHEIDILREFKELLAIPNLASDAQNIRRNADAIVALFARRSIPARLLESPGAPPVVFASLAAPGARHTVIFYAHNDGQPVDPARWSGKPWEPVVRDGPVESGGKGANGRGATSHGGNTSASLLGALCGQLPVEWYLFTPLFHNDNAIDIEIAATNGTAQNSGRNSGRLRNRAVG